MLRRTIALLCIAAALPAFGQELSASPDPRHALSGAALVKALQGGGYSLYFRHTSTDMSQSDSRYKIGDCSTQRNLTDAGRDEARRIGAVMVALKLPVGDVIASPYCRTMETAKLMAGRAPRAEDAVRGSAGPTGKPDYSALSKILATPPREGTLRLVSGHGNPMAGLRGQPHLAEGEAMVIKGTGSDWFIVARIRVDDWKALAPS